MLTEIVAFAFYPTRTGKLMHLVRVPPGRKHPVRMKALCGARTVLDFGRDMSPDYCERCCELHDRWWAGTPTYAMGVC